VTIRNACYYQTLGLLPPVLRHGGRAGFSERHVDAIVNIKRSQARGRSLAVVPTFRDVAAALAPVVAPMPERPLHRPMAAWIAPINESVQLIGTGPAPSPRVLDLVASFLAADPTSPTLPDINEMTEESSS